MLEETIDQLKILIAERLDLNIRKEDIDSDAALLEGGLKLDSLAVVELITASEAYFGVQFGEENLNIDTFGSVRSLAAVITALRAPALA